jgi:hypothetical protein
VQNLTEVARVNSLLNFAMTMRGGTIWTKHVVLEELDY